MSTSSTLALFVMLEPSSKSVPVTFTFNVKVVSPFTSSCFFPTFTSIPSFKSSAVYPSSGSSAASFGFISKLTNSVPVGTVSFTFTVPSAEPVFVNFIVYVIISSFCTFLFPLSDVFSPDISGFPGSFTYVSTVFVLVLFTIAKFSILLLCSLSGKVSTVTSKLKTTFLTSSS